MQDNAAVRKRLKDLLVMQRGCFENYISVLEKQHHLIGAGKEESALRLVDLEEQLVARIFTVQKSIDPLEVAVFASGAPDSAGDIAALKAELESLESGAKLQSQRNRELLSERMANIRTEINIIKTNPIAINARRFKYQHGAALVDVRG